MMSEKQQIDAIRNGSIRMKIGDDRDGVITGMVTICGKMHVVKERSISKILTADNIDPDRTNLQTPNTQQIVAQAGSDSETVCRILLTADQLFQKNMIRESVDTKKAKKICLELLKEILAAEDIATTFLNDVEDAAFSKKVTNIESFSVPTVGNLENRTKNFISRAEHAIQKLYQLTQIFYDHDEKFFDGFHAKLEKLYGVDDEFTIFAKRLAVFAKQIRNIRNCMEHTRPSQRLELHDFNLNKNSQLSRPTIEVIHNESPISTGPISEFMVKIVEKLVAGGENLLAHLADKNMNPKMNEFAGMKVIVGVVPESQRSIRNVRLGYLIGQGGSWIKIDS